MNLTDREKELNRQRFIVKTDYCMWDEKTVWRIWDNEYNDFVDPNQSFHTFESAEKYANQMNKNTAI